MKDYTKYDFNVIVGAEVELQVKYFGCYKGKVLCRWEYEGKPYLTIFVCKPEGSHLSDIPIDEIVPNSLTAKIKVEDMSLKQLKQYAEILKERNGEKARVVFTVHQEQRDEYVYFACTLHDCPSKFITDEYRHFTDYIDCTDWGWRE